jgi:hypothetical protein
MVKLPTDTTLCPRLSALLELISAKRPLFEYLMNSRERRSVNGAPTQYACVSVDVWQHGFYVGKVTSAVSRDTKDGRESWYGIESETIRKTRGHNRQLLASKKVDVALKNALHHLQKPPASRVAAKTFDGVARNVENIVWKAESKFTRSMGKSGSINTTKVMEYFVEKFKGNSDFEVPMDFRNIDYNTLMAYDNMKIYREFLLNDWKNKRVHIISLLPNGFLLEWLAGREDNARVYESLDSMPVFMQEKITMLKLLKEEEFVPNIGVRFGNLESTDLDEEKTFVVVHGETVLN